MSSNHQLTPTFLPSSLPPSLNPSQPQFLHSVPQVIQTPDSNFPHPQPIFERDSNLNPLSIQPTQFTLSHHEPLRTDASRLKHKRHPLRLQGPPLTVGLQHQQPPSDLPPVDLTSDIRHRLMPSVSRSDRSMLLRNHQPGTSVVAPRLGPPVSTPQRPRVDCPPLRPAHDLRFPYEEERRKRDGQVVLQLPDGYMGAADAEAERMRRMEEPLGVAYEMKNDDVVRKRELVMRPPVPRTEGVMQQRASVERQNAGFAHGTIEKRVACESCGLLFGDIGSLKRHAARAHRVATGKGPVFCSQCSASLKNEQNLRRHVAVCHSGDQENRCDMCSASFSSRGSLRIHQQHVHQVGNKGRNVRGGMSIRRRMGGGVAKAKSDKSYVCDLCTDTFKWKGNLKRHRELRHLQLRPFSCSICDARFGTKSNMRVHQITHNNQSGK